MIFICKYQDNQPAEPVKINQERSGLSGILAEHAI
jgi:hypothetical protein